MSVALVTGGTAGIGLAIARALAEDGLKVALCGRDAGRAENAAREVGEGTLGLVADVADEAAVQAAVARTVDAFGRLDVLVANAGIDGEWARVEQLSSEDFAHTIAVNLTGTYNTVRAAMPHLRASGGHAILVASISALRPTKGSAAYASSKAGMRALAATLQKEGADDGVRVTALNPGYVATAMTAGTSVPQEEMLTPGDVAESVRFLLRLSPLAMVREINLERLANVNPRIVEF